MVTPPIVPKKQAGSNKQKSEMAPWYTGPTPSRSSSANSPIASTSTSKILQSDSAQQRDDEEMDGEAEEDGEWQTSSNTRTSASHPSTSDGAAVEEEDDAVMIDPNSLLPPTSTGGEQVKITETTSQDQGLLKFPALSAKEAQGKIETQLRKVSVST